MCACGQDMEGLEECEFGERKFVHVCVWTGFKNFLRVALDATY